MATELPFRWVNPDINPNHTGLGDLKVATKTVLVNGEVWQFTNLMRLYFNTGSASMGTGTGHLSLEPGLLARYKWSEFTNLHGEIKYWVPMGGTPSFSGQVLEYGLGISHLLYEDDSIAYIPTFEVVAWSILNGQKTTPAGLVVDANAEDVVALLPGLRVVMDKGGDLGLFEFGISGGIGLGNSQFYDGMWRLDFRWSY